jgi:uncharacterized membrane protein
MILKKEKNMVEEKHWYQSRTIWGALIAVIASLFGALGISIDGTTQNEISEVMLKIVSVLGAVTAIYGRLSATEIIS